MAFLWRDPLPPRALVVAHRGGAALGRENTAAAIAAARQAGADAVEVDVRLTADGALVCVHDADLMRLAGDPRHVARIDLAALHALLPGLLTPADVVAASGDLGILFDVKLNEPALLELLAAAALPAAARVLLGLRTTAMVAAAAAAAPDMARLAFAADPDAVSEAQGAGAHWFRLWEGMATPPRLAAVRAAGLRSVVMVGQPRSVPFDEWPPFPVGGIDRTGLDALRALSPDAVMLDDPSLVAASAVNPATPAPPP